MIAQTNTFICDYCGEVVGITSRGDVYSDPVITPPAGWDCMGERDCCPECIAIIKENQK